MTANEHQVGGDHYKSEYQHWDWVLVCHLDYLEGQATRYVSRWRKKNGLQDLRKALHFVDKMIEHWGEGASRMGVSIAESETLRFAKANNLPDLEFVFCVAMATWRNASDLVRARNVVWSLITSHPDFSKEYTKPVPRTDSNKHAQQEE